MHDLLYLFELFTGMKCFILFDAQHNKSPEPLFRT